MQMTNDHGRMTNDNCALEVFEGVAEVFGGEGTPGSGGDVVADEAGGAVSEGDEDATGVETAGGGVGGALVVVVVSRRAIGAAERGARGFVAAVALRDGAWSPGAIGDGGVGGVEVRVESSAHVAEGDVVDRGPDVDAVFEAFG